MLRDFIIIYLNLAIRAFILSELLIRSSVTAVALKKIDQFACFSLYLEFGILVVSDDVLMPVGDIGK